MRIAIFTQRDKDQWVRETIVTLTTAGHTVVALFISSPTAYTFKRTELVRVDMPRRNILEDFCKQSAITMTTGSPYAPKAKELCETLQVEQIVILDPSLDARTLSGYAPHGVLGLFLGRGACAGSQDAVKYSILDGIGMGATAIHYLPKTPPAKVFELRVGLDRGDTILEAGLKCRFAQMALLAEVGKTHSDGSEIQVKTGKLMSFANEKKMIARFKEYKQMERKLP